MNGKRIESYLHSDNSTENKGGSLIELKSETDFASRTDEFKAFAKKIAQLAFGSLSARPMQENCAYTLSLDWENIVEVFPFIEDEKKELEKNLGEKIIVGKIAIIS